MIGVTIIIIFLTSSVVIPSYSIPKTRSAIISAKLDEWNQTTFTVTNITEPSYYECCELTNCQCTALQFPLDCSLPVPILNHTDVCNNGGCSPNSVETRGVCALNRKCHNVCQPVCGVCASIIVSGSYDLFTSSDTLSCLVIDMSVCVSSIESSNMISSIRPVWYRHDDPMSRTFSRPSYPPPDAQAYEVVVVGFSVAMTLSELGCCFPPLLHNFRVMNVLKRKCDDYQRSQADKRNAWKVAFLLGNLTNVVNGLHHASPCTYAYAFIPSD
jgi:hypothetical protein